MTEPGPTLNTAHPDGKFRPLLACCDGKASHADDCRFKAQETPATQGGFIPITTSEQEAWTDGYGMATAHWRPLAVEALSTLENYGDHHDWCRSVDDCNCGLAAQIASLTERIHPKEADRAGA